MIPGQIVPTGQAEHAADPTHHATDSTADDAAHDASDGPGRATARGRTVLGTADDALRIGRSRDEERRQ